MVERNKSLEHVSCGQDLFECGVSADLPGGRPRDGIVQSLQAALVAAREGGPCPALVLLEIDRLAALRERFQAGLGELILSEAGRRIQRCSAAGAAVERCGDDGFAVLLPDAPETWSLRLAAERLRLALRTPFEVGCGTFRLSASIGTASFPLDGETAEQLVRHAARAVAEAKRAGGDRCRLLCSSLEEAASDPVTAAAAGLRAESPARPSRLGRRR